MNTAHLLQSKCQNLRFIQQHKLCLSPFEQHSMAFTLVVAESDIFPIDVPVAHLQLSDQLAFGYFPLPNKRYRPTLYASVARSKQSFLNRRNIAQNFRRSVSACRFVMVHAEYLSPSNNLCPYPTYG